MPRRDRREMTPKAEIPADPITDAEPPQPTDAEEAEIEAAARVTDADLDDAVESWRKHAPKRFRDLLDAS